MPTSPFTCSTASGVASMVTLTPNSSTAPYGSTTGVNFQTCGGGVYSAASSLTHAPVSSSATTCALSPTVPALAAAPGSGNASANGSSSSGHSAFARLRRVTGEPRASPSLGPAPGSCPMPSSLAVPDFRLLASPSKTHSMGNFTATSGGAHSTRSTATPPPRRSRALSPARLSVAPTVSPSPTLRVMGVSTEGATSSSSVATRSPHASCISNGASNRPTPSRPSALTLPPLQPSTPPQLPQQQPQSQQQQAGKCFSTHSPAKERRTEVGRFDVAADSANVKAAPKTTRVRPAGLTLAAPTVAPPTTAAAVPSIDEPPLQERAVTTGALPTESNSASALKESAPCAVHEVPLGGDGSPPSSQARMSKCKLKMRAIAAPAFDIKKVEEISQCTLRGGTPGLVSAAVSATHGAANRASTSADNAGLRFRLPGVEDCFYEEGICNAAECHPISRVNDFIYLGTWRDANNAETLRAHGITYVLNCATEVSNSEERDEMAALRCNVDLGSCDMATLFPTYGAASDARCDEADTSIPTHAEGVAHSPKIFIASIPMLDTHKERLDEKIDTAFYFILLARKNRAKILVHCRRGISRSAAVVVAFLMATRGTPFEETYNRVVERRSCVSLNLGFREFLSDNFHPDPKWALVHAALLRRDGVASSDVTSTGSPGLCSTDRYSSGPSAAGGPEDPQSPALGRRPPGIGFGHAAAAATGTHGFEVEGERAGDGDGLVDEPVPPLRECEARPVDDGDSEVTKARETATAVTAAARDSATPHPPPGLPSRGSRAASRGTSTNSSAFGFAPISDGASFSDEPSEKQMASNRHKADCHADGEEDADVGSSCDPSSGPPPSTKDVRIGGSHCGGGATGGGSVESSDNASSCLSTSPAPSLSATPHHSGVAYNAMNSKHLGSFQTSSASSSITGGCTTATNTSHVIGDHDGTSTRRLSPQRQISGVSAHGSSSASSSIRGVGPLQNVSSLQAVDVAFAHAGRPSLEDGAR